MDKIEPFKALGCVFFGAGIGGCARYGLSLAIKSLAFPWATFAANALGCLLMGILLSQLERDSNPYVRLAIGVGVLGGFTTFSAFSAEFLQLVQKGQALMAIGYAAMSVLVSLSLTAVGFSVWTRFTAVN